MTNNNHSDGSSEAVKLRDRLLARHKQEHAGLEGYLAAEEEGIRSMIRVLAPDYYSQSSIECKPTETETVRVETPHVTEKPSSSQQTTALAKPNKSIDDVDMKIAGHPSGARIRATLKPNQSLRMKIQFAENSKMKVTAQLSAVDAQPNPKVVNTPVDKKKLEHHSDSISKCECSECIDIPLNKFMINESDNQNGFKEQALSTSESTLCGVHSLPLQVTESSTFVSEL
ncbi:hypothetical protein M3Y95_00808600 [Aphelenchoides besseyi]|nr:hypothetical protein M3Y95_00808600 [Aphelenchoides besseyi]